MSSVRSALSRAIALELLRHLEAEALAVGVRHRQQLALMHAAAGPDPGLPAVLDSVGIEQRHARLIPAAPPRKAPPIAPGHGLGVVAVLARAPGREAARDRERLMDPIRMAGSGLRALVGEDRELLPGVQESPAIALEVAVQHPADRV